MLVVGSANCLPTHSCQRLQHIWLAELCRTRCRRQTRLYWSQGKQFSCLWCLRTVWTDFTEPWAFGFLSPVNFSF